MRYSIILAVTIGLAGIVSGGSAAAQVPESGTILIDINAAPDVAPSIDVRLLLGATDVTATYCGPALPDSGAVTSCTGLPDGTYSIDIVGAPAGANTAVNCIDVVAARRIDPVIDIDGAFWDWTCEAFVGTPAVLLTVNGAESTPVPAGVSVGIVPADAPSDCVADETNASPATRCRGLAPGTYDMSVAGVPDTYIDRGGASCSSLIFAAPDFAYAAGPQAVVTDESWLWWCDVSLAPRAVVDVQVFGGGYTLPAELAIEVTGPDGVTDVSDQCVETFLDATFGANWACPLPTGTYSVAFPALADAPVTASCEELVLPDEQTDQVFCAWTIEASSPPVSIIPPSTILVRDVLPPTGATDTATAWLATTALAAGAALVLIARRRRSIG